VDRYAALARERMSKVPCKTCGIAILVTTAVRNDGLCVPCKKGTRKRLEAAKQWYREEREREKSDPFRKLWRELVRRVYETSEGFDSLSEPERQYFAVRLLEREIYNGGFEQYFFNSSSGLYGHAIEGLEAMGASYSLDLLRQAKEFVFGAQEAMADTGSRREFLRARVDDACSQELNKLDVLFCKDHDSLSSRAEEFARSRGILGAA
jgi:hypothetical protein